MNRLSKISEEKRFSDPTRYQTLFSWIEKKKCREWVRVLFISSWWKMSIYLNPRNNKTLAFLVVCAWRNMLFYGPVVKGCLFRKEKKLYYLQTALQPFKKFSEQIFAIVICTTTTTSTTCTAEIFSILFTTVSMMVMRNS